MAKNDKQKKSNDSKPITNDPRFSSVHNDPRFKLPNLNKLKVKVDDRFNKDELTNFKKNKTKYDRYGRRLKKGEETSTFDRLYKQDKKEESDSESESSDSETKELKVASSSSDEESDEDSEVETKILDRARGEVDDEEESSSESDSDSDSSDEEEISEGEEEIELEETKPEEGDPERRFAVVNLDWDNVTSTDLFAAFTSFLPLKGEIRNISIYPSEYGKEKMQKEEIEGPPRDLFQSKKSKKSKKQEDSDDESDSDISDIETAAKKLYEEGDGEQDYDSKALRRYQLQRLRYYYAVVTCDSIATAKSIYDNCDGTEYESSANIFDLRYIPEDMEFDDKARDSCDKIPASYRPNAFVTDALQSSKAKLTWDETPNERIKMSTKAFSQREIEDMDFKAYLASDSEDEENGEDLKNKYKNLVQSSTKIGDKSIFENGDEEEEEGVDMEITFTPGLADGAKKEEVNTEESTIEAYKRKEKERRKKRMERFKEAQKNATNDNPEEDEVKQKTKNGKKKHSKKEDSNKNDTAELELLTMDADETNHFNMRDVLKLEKEKSRKRQSKKMSRKIDREMVQDDFKPDLSDPRFKEIFENHEFAIDPTMPNFKKTETMKQILEERQKRRKNGFEEDGPNYKKKKNYSK